MANKLQELTEKLYGEGLEKGRAEGERMVAEAKAEAAKILAEAEAKAEAVVKAAQDKAEDIEKNTMTEIALAGKQAIAKIKAEIAEMIIAKSTSEAVKSATLDAAFVKDRLHAIGMAQLRRSSSTLCFPRLIRLSSQPLLRRAQRSCSQQASRLATRRT